MRQQLKNKEYQNFWVVKFKSFNRSSLSLRWTIIALLKGFGATFFDVGLIPTTVLSSGSDAKCDGPGLRTNRFRLLLLIGVNFSEYICWTVRNFIVELNIDVALGDALRFTCLSISLRSKGLEADCGIPEPPPLKVL